MAAKLLTAWGYQGDNMNLPVRDVESAVPFYVDVLGFRCETLNEGPPKSAVLGRDGIQMRLAENGGDPEQDGCAFRVDDVEELLVEFKSNGLQKEISDLSVENRKDGSSFKVFFVVAPDGLCYWFGELLA
jgi:catechol 2,3-dioxygenase-like lactoylglutathione lyase family enzyme